MGITVLHSGSIPLREPPPTAQGQFFGRGELIEEIVRLAEILTPIIGINGERMRRAWRCASTRVECKHYDARETAVSVLPLSFDPINKRVARQSLGYPYGPET